MTDPASPRDRFATTRWTVVLAAAHSDTLRARAALGKLYRTYWYPLYGYVRRLGYSPADAEDLTQGYFTRLLELESLSAVSREKGKFRSFLLASLRHFLADEWDKASAQKRDVRRTVALDTGAAETRYRNEPADTETPERLFERQWALTLLETVVQRLRQEHETAGRSEWFTALNFTITADRQAIPYADLAVRLGSTEAALRVAVHRLRQRYRQLLRVEIADTVASEGDIDEEMRYLRRVLSR